MADRYIPANDGLHFLNAHLRQDGEPVAAVRTSTLIDDTAIHDPGAPVEELFARAEAAEAAAAKVAPRGRISQWLQNVAVKFGPRSPHKDVDATPFKESVPAMPIVGGDEEGFLKAVAQEAKRSSTAIPKGYVKPVNIKPKPFSELLETIGLKEDVFYTHATRFEKGGKIVLGERYETAIASAAKAARAAVLDKKDHQMPDDPWLLNDAGRARMNEIDAAADVLKNGKTVHSHYQKLDKVMSATERSAAETARNEAIKAEQAARVEAAKAQASQRAAAKAEAAKAQELERRAARVEPKTKPVNAPKMSKAEAQLTRQSTSVSKRKPKVGWSFNPFEGKGLLAEEAKEGAKLSKGGVVVLAGVGVAGAAVYAYTHAEKPKKFVDALDAEQSATLGNSRG